jgi:glyoxylase-like metal-dependent hydrolase (beta-lactamase superfamily II)
MVGHTWGQQAVRFDDGAGVVCFPGDVMPTIHHAGPAYSLGYDMLPHENMVSKQRLLEHAARDGWRIVLDHEPGNPVVRVVPEPDHAGRFSLETVAGT